MLSKVLKYDLKFVYKVLIVFYFLVIFFAILTRLFFSFEDSFILNVLAKIFSGFTISFMFSILINNLMRLWARFIKNCYSDESYLTHTLPVSKKCIYASKFITSIVTMLTSVLIILLSIFIAYYSKENMLALKSALNIIATMYESSVIGLILIVFFVFFLEMVFAVQSGYFGIIVGHNSNNNKMAKTIIYGFLIYLFTNALIILGLFIGGLFNSNLMNLFKTIDVVNIRLIKNIMYGAMVVYLLIIVIFYIVNISIFKKGVNVD